MMWVALTLALHNEAFRNMQSAIGTLQRCHARAMNALTFFAHSQCVHSRDAQLGRSEMSLMIVS